MRRGPDKLRLLIIFTHMGIVRPFSYFCATPPVRLVFGRGFVPWIVAASPGVALGSRTQRASQEVPMDRRYDEACVISSHGFSHSYRHQCGERMCRGAASIDRKSFTRPSTGAARPGGNRRTVDQVRANVLVLMYQGTTKHDLGVSRQGDGSRVGDICALIARTRD